MNILTLDFETYFDDDYTLKKLTTEHYVRDARFEALMCGFSMDNGKREWVPQEYIAEAIADYAVASSAVLCHHAAFDGLILSHHYNTRPKMWLDTLSMARLQLGNHISVALKSLAEHYGLQEKSVPYDKFKGKRWAEIDAPLRRELGVGCLHDIALTRDVFERLRSSNEAPFPQEEYQTIDYTIRMFTEPQLVGDLDVFAKVWKFEAKRKQELLYRLADDLGADVTTLPKILGSNKTFIALLEAEDVEIEWKPGKPKNGEPKLIPAFAKTDDFMVNLLEDDDERIRTFAECRLGLKSTLDQTRAERLGFMATRGAMCLYLSYCAAHTTRWGGGDKINPQNFKRGSDLRKGLVAPAGYKIVKADKSQIECRILNYVAEQWDVIERFREGHDPYLPIASQFYGREITKSDAAERGVGKQFELSCGYGAGGPTIQRTAARGTYGPPVKLSEMEGLAARDLYRSTHPFVVNYWKQAGRIIGALAGTNSKLEWGPLAIESGKISLQGIPIWYPELHFHRDEETGEEYWRYKTRKGWAKLYGGKLVENVVQFMSRVDMSGSLLRILARTNIRPAQLEHDAAVWCVKEELVVPFTNVVQEEMTRAPTWLPGIPLACEITVGETM